MSTAQRKKGRCTSSLPAAAAVGAVRAPRAARPHLNTNGDEIW